MKKLMVMVMVILTMVTVVACGNTDNLDEYQIEVLSEVLTEDNEVEVVEEEEVEEPEVVDVEIISREAYVNCEYVMNIWLRQVYSDGTETYEEISLDEAEALAKEIYQ